MLADRLLCVCKRKLDRAGDTQVLARLSFRLLSPLMMLHAHDFYAAIQIPRKKGKREQEEISSR